MKRKRQVGRYRLLAWMFAGLFGAVALPIAALEQGIWRETAVVGSPAPESGSDFGSGLGLNQERLVVGQRFAAVNGNALQGSAHIYRLDADGAVVFSQTLTAADGAADDRFGAAVAIGGGLIVIGAERADINAIEWRGAWYVFTAGVQDNFAQTAKLIAPDGQTFDEFGTTAATDGVTILGATPQGCGALADQGAAYHFVAAGDLWQFNGKLTDPAGASADQFGIAIDLAGDLALIGAPRATVSGNAFQGRALVFRFVNGAWELAQTLTASDGQAFDTFGSAVALAGEQLLIGASAADGGGLNNRGAIYVFDLTPGGQWVERQKLFAPDAAEEDLFGDALAVSGGRAVVGAPQATGNAERSGVVYVLERDATGEWSFAGPPGRGQGAEFQRLRPAGGDRRRFACRRGAGECLWRHWRRRPGTRL